MLSWQSILRIGCQTERLAQLRAFAIIGVILLQRRSRITMPPCEYFTLFYIQCGVYTEFGIEPLLLLSCIGVILFSLKFFKTVAPLLLSCVREMGVLRSLYPRRTCTFRYRSVSYTHLDVYKRQTLLRFIMTLSMLR